MSEVNRREPFESMQKSSPSSHSQCLVFILFYVLENFHGVSVYFTLYLPSFIAFFAGHCSFKKLHFVRTLTIRPCKSKNLSFWFREFLHEKCAILGPQKLSKVLPIAVCFFKISRVDHIFPAGKWILVQKAKTKSVKYFELPEFEFYCHLSLQFQAKSSVIKH